MSKKSNNIDKKREQFVKKILRRASLRWEARNQAKVNARVSRGLYRCIECPPNKLHGPSDIELDHKEPVVPVDRPDIGLMEWIERLLADVDNWQILCKNHHLGKSSHENFIRDIKRKNKKKIKR